MYYQSWNNVHVNHYELRAFLTTLNLTQADFARLIGVTARGVNLWMTEERAIPGPVAAYARLLAVLPEDLRQDEFNRLKVRSTAMRDGMFGITFQGREGSGMGIMIFDSGRVCGTDTEGVRYDGGYAYDEASGFVDVKIKVTFPPNVRAVFGISHPYEWAFEVTTRFDPNKDSGALQVATSMGQPLQAQYKFLRALSEAA
jgi:DNA-binding transcriptional regulator YdaS (Cro superfamily)